MEYFETPCTQFTDLRKLHEHILHTQELHLST